MHRQIRPLPPVTSPERVVAAVVRAVDHPEREIVVGRAHNLAAWFHRLTPRLYDLLVVPVVNAGALRDIPVHSHDGNVFTPELDTHGVTDGWRKRDHRLVGRTLTAAASVAALVAAARASRKGRE